MNHGFNALGVAAALMVASLGLWLVPKKVPPPEAPLEAPVPIQEFTPADAGVIVLPTMRVLILGLPKPGPNQIKDAKQCKSPAEFRSGGCWLAVAKKPPCNPPEGEPRNLWEDEGLCWFPVAHARLPPTSGEPRRPGGVAGQ